MNEVNTMPRFETDALNQQEVDAAFAGMVASMNMVNLDLSSVQSNAFKAEKDTKFGVPITEAMPVNEHVAIEGISVVDQQALKGDIAAKFNPELIAQAKVQNRMEEQRMFDFFMADDAEKKKKKS